MVDLEPSLPGEISHTSPVNAIPILPSLGRSSHTALVPSFPDCFYRIQPACIISTLSGLAAFHFLNQICLMISTEHCLSATAIPTDPTPVLHLLCCHFLLNLPTAKYLHHLHTQMLSCTVQIMHQICLVRLVNLTNQCHPFTHRSISGHAAPSLTFAGEFFRTMISYAISILLCLNPDALTTYQPCL